MAGLAKMCKLFGRMKYQDANGKTVMWYYDWVEDKPRIESEMTKEEIQASEKVKWQTTKAEFDKLFKKWNSGE